MEKAKGRDKHVASLMVILSRHVGRENAVGMDELYERVFGEPVRHKINDTRHLRTLITELRRRGVPIAATSTAQGGGYYLARATSELEEYCQKLRSRAMHSLVTESKLRKIALPELLGQMQMSLQGGRE